MFAHLGVVATVTPFLARVFPFLNLNGYLYKSNFVCIEEVLTSISKFHVPEPHGGRGSMEFEYMRYSEFLRKSFKKAKLEK